MDTDITLAPGRACGSCTLCCKVMRIRELDKPPGEWCPHCAIGKGCKIYDSRPEDCRIFYCGYLIWDTLPDYWFPANSKIVVTSELGGDRLTFHVDPARPDAWRKEPFYSDIRRMSANRPHKLAQVLVRVDRNSTVIFPEREIELGYVSPDERIITFEIMTPNGPAVDAVKVRADDPRLAGREVGKTYRD